MGRMLRDEELEARDSASEYPDSPLPVGALAPDFHWVDDDGRPARLHDLRGQPVLLAFFAPQWDPAREHQLWAYNEVLKRLPSGGTVLGLAHEGQWCEIMLDGEGSMRFPLLGNLGVEGDIARRYGAVGAQAIFVIDESGVVRWRHVATDGMLVQLDDLTHALSAVPERRSVTRREFLATTLAVSIALTVLPRIGRAQGGAGESAAAEASVRPITLHVN